MIDRLAVAAATLGDPDVCRLVESVREYGRTARLQILVVGLVGAGRASVVNTLVGCPGLLPQTAVPKAPVSLVLRHGPPGAAEARAADGTRIAVPADRVGSFLCDPATASTYGSVELAGSCEALQTSDVRVEALEADRSPQDWRDLLATSDFTIVVLNATAPLSEAERAFIRDHLAGVGLQQVALVVNRMDLVPEEERDSILELLRTFLGRFESQPVILDVAATRPDHQLPTLLADLLAQHAAVRAAALRQASETALEALTDVAAQEMAGASMERTEVEGLQQSLRARQEWLQGRIERAQRRVAAFVGTLLREQLQQEIQGFGEVFRRRLPDEIRSIEDLATIKRYLPGYIETVWQGVVNERMIATRSRLLEEVQHSERIIENDLRELIEAALGDLRGSVRDFDPVADRLRAFVMPKRGKHSASSVARGLSLHGFVILILSSFVPFISPVAGLLSLGAGQAVRRLFKRDIETADREAIVAAATAAAREMERELQREINRQFSRLKTQLEAEVAAQYSEAVKRMEQALRESAARAQDAAARREQLTVLTERTIPELRRLLDVRTASGSTIHRDHARGAI